MIPPIQTTHIVLDNLKAYGLIALRQRSPASVILPYAGLYRVDGIQISDWKEESFFLSNAENEAMLANSYSDIPHPVSEAIDVISEHMDQFVIPDKCIRLAVLAVGVQREFMRLKFSYNLLLGSFCLSICARAFNDKLREPIIMK